MKYIFSLSACLLMISCAYHYVASAPYVPLNDKKGELKINPSINSLQIGYSAFDHISFFTTGFYHQSLFGSLFMSENKGDYSKEDKIYEINLGTSYFNKVRFFDNRDKLELLFWEPGFSFKAGSQKAKFTMSVCQTINLTKYNIIYNQFNFQLGFLLNLDLNKSKM